jgi:GAF domain-containing protein
MGQAVTSLLDLDKLLNRVIEATVYLCRSDEAVLYLIDESTDELYMTAAQGVGARASHRLRLRVSDSLLGEVVRTGRPIIRNSAGNGDQIKVKTGYIVRSAANVPLRVKDRCIGVLGVANRVRTRCFTRTDVRRLCALANYAAIAIENARLYEATRKVIAAEVLNNTVVTVSHYVNNPLMSLMVNADRLVQAQQDGTLADSDDAVQENMRYTEMKVEEISAVLSILHDLTLPHFVTYLEDIKMLDIETKVQARLRSIKEKYAI